MDVNDTLNGILDELHNININLVELIKVIKENKNDERNTVDPELENTLSILADAMSAHKSQLEANQAAATPERIEADNAYQRQQSNLDQALKRLGVM